MSKENLNSSKSVVNTENVQKELKNLSIEKNVEQVPGTENELKDGENFLNSNTTTSGRLC